MAEGAWFSHGSILRKGRNMVGKREKGRKRRGKEEEENHLQKMNENPGRKKYFAVEPSFCAW